MKENSVTQKRHLVGKRLCKSSEGCVFALVEREKFVLHYGVNKKLLHVVRDGVGNNLKQLNTIRYN